MHSEKAEADVPHKEAATGVVPLVNTLLWDNNEGRKGDYSIGNTNKVARELRPRNKGGGNWGFQAQTLRAMEGKI